MPKAGKAKQEIVKTMTDKYGTILTEEELGSIYDDNKGRPYMKLYQIYEQAAEQQKGKKAIECVTKTGDLKKQIVKSIQKVYGTQLTNNEIDSIYEKNKGILFLSIFKVYEAAVASKG